MFGLFKKKNENTPCSCNKEPNPVATIRCNVYSVDDDTLEGTLKVILYECPLCHKRTYLANNEMYIVSNVKELLKKWLSKQITTKQIVQILKDYC